MGKCEGKRPLARQRHRWQDHIKMELKEIRLERGDSIHLGLDRDKRRLFVNTTIKFRTP
jgi:hypothetical protein